MGDLSTSNRAKGCQSEVPPIVATTKV